MSSVCAFEGTWASGIGMLLVGNFDQPSVTLTRGDIVGAAYVAKVDDPLLIAACLPFDSAARQPLNSAACQPFDPSMAAPVPLPGFAHVIVDDPLFERIFDTEIP